ncbi:MAG: class I SAM-dependent methyltransferase [Defluviitaleaceae bacterium]|nr:class I SAM-dependent methyltransferase [Defluviitaleaceae bacterium]
MKTTNPIQDCWNQSADNWYVKNAPCHQAVMAQPSKAFPQAVYPLLQKYLGDMRGKKVLVPSSGDNVAAFGFHLLGANVTSCDLSENQLQNAESIAKANGWDITFITQDTMTLDGIPDNTYDLVYTSNGAHVWINDMPRMYQNICRVLKKGGYSIFFETHPMSRPFDSTTYEVKIKQHYADVFVWANDPVPNYLWRTQDFVNAITASGLVIKEMQEFHSQREDLPCHNYLYIAPDDEKGNANWPGDTFDWKNNPWAALPQCLCICSQK